MPILVRGLTLEIDEPPELLPARAAKRLRISAEQIRLWAIVRRALDARRHDRLSFIYNLELALAGSRQDEERLVRRLGRQDVGLLQPVPEPVIIPGREPLPERPIIIGFGPAGMFAGLLLARFGYRPLILERGADVIARHRHVLVDFYRHGQLNAESNLLFGEGGAGAYSDGKLYTRVHDPRCRLILETFFAHGADPEILIEGRPHIGSDKLPGICRRIRQKIVALGGAVRFLARLDDVLVQEGRLQAIIVNGEKIACGPVLLAIGLSARDTLRMLARRGVALESKPWQMGVRIEHPQELVDRWQYGPQAGHPRLPPAEYHLVARDAAGRWGDCFSFCMCPGGMILPTTETPGRIATNGASRAKRGGRFANSALVVTVDAAQMVPAASADPLAGLDFLDNLERAAFQSTGDSYRVPAQRADDFVERRRSDGRLETSYPFGGQWIDWHELLPPDLADALARAISQLDRRRGGFAGPQGLVTGPETRGSSPLRIHRHPHSRESVSVQNLYPIGEGAGYAGGIVSAALDGLKTAEKLMAMYAPPM